jgi:hypothetical protein
MASDPNFRIYALVGVCLLHVQLAERALAVAVETVLEDPKLTAAKFMAQTEQEQKRTLGGVITELKRRAGIEPEFNKKLWRFLEMRNTFVHNLPEVPGFDLSTEGGREATTKFVAELLGLALGMTGVFTSLLTISGKGKFRKDLIERHRLISPMQEHFGPTARKILAGRYRKLTLVHSKGSASE